MNFVIANWKMKMSLNDVEKWVDKFGSIYDGERSVKSDILTVIAPTFLHVPYVKAQLTARGVLDQNVSIGVQNLSANERGSHTGEVGAFQVKDFCDFAIVGHSERAEGPALVAEKRDIALDYGLIPVVCFSSPAQADFFYKEGIILAWEDPENISSGGSYNEKPLEDIVNTVKRMRNALPSSAVLLYGGSVHRGNIGNLVNIPGLNGVLIGHASLKADHFTELIKAYEVS